MTELGRLFDDALAARLKTRYTGTNAVDDAVRYVLEAGGKRVRPMLCLLAAEAVGGDPRQALGAALAVEFVHTYSLVHDDLPCMDDDDLRRGKPTAHKVFGEANALLCGDALLTDAFGILAEEKNPALGLALVRELAAAAGGAGMVLGQSLDLHWTARDGATKAALDEIHLKKTGHLLGAAAAMGALAGGATDAVAARFRSFGRLTGLAFQVLDDLLDDAEGTGKSSGKDQAAGKLTYLTLMSRDEAQRAADRYTADAIQELTTEGVKPDALITFARALLSRKS
jgi:geranylgeranyl diphosphate synthase type II